LGRGKGKGSGRPPGTGAPPEKEKKDTIIIQIIPSFAVQSGGIGHFIPK